MYAYKVRKYIGSYYAVLNGLDLLVFTGGIGENDFKMREMICSGMEALGIEFDHRENDGVRGQDKLISKPGSKAAVMTITTNEELVIAMDTKYLVERHSV